MTPKLPTTTSTTGSTTGNTSTPKTYTVTIGEPVATRFVKDATGAVELEVPVKYTLTDKTIKSPVTEQIIGVIYNKNDAKKSEYSGAYDPTYNVLYNTQSTFGYYWSELVKDNEYVVYFYDKKTGAKSPYVSLIYKTDGTFTANKIASLPSWTSNTNGNTVPTTPSSNITTTSGAGTGTQQASSTTSLNGITTTFTASPVYINQYSGSMDAVKVNGFVKYTNPTKSISLATAQAGTILVNLIDKNGYVKSVDEIDLGNYDTVYDKDIPLDSALLAVGNSLDPDVSPQPIFKPSDAPFTVKIIDTKLDARSKAFIVAMPSINGSSNSNSNTNSNTSSTVHS
jgi:hypothetical protein